MKNIFRFVRFFGFLFVVFCLFATMNTLHAQWIQTNGPYGGNIRALAVKSNGYVFAGTYDGGIYRSMDNGGTWTNVGFTSTSVGAIVINSTGTIFAGTNGGVYSSDNNGGSWTQIFDLGINGIISLAINPNGDIFFVNGGGIYRSMDNWNRINNTISGLISTDIYTIAINSLNGHIFAGSLSGGVFRSENNGENWTQINNTTSGLTNTDVYTLAINSNGDIFAGTISGGVFRSTDNGDNWTLKNNGFQYIPSVLSLTFNSLGHVFAGTNNAGVWRSTDNGDHWTQVLNTTNNYFYALATKNSDIVYAGTTGTGIFLSANNGDVGTWNQVNTDLIATHVTSLAINSSGSIFAGANASGIFRSADNGGNWMLTTSGPALYMQTQSLAINSNGYIFSGTDQGVYLSMGGGGNWIPKFNSTNFNRIYALFISNAVGSIDYVYTGTEGGGVFRSIDDGNNWTQFNSGNSGLTNSTILSLAVNSSGHVFAGTNGGAFFYTTDNGGVFRYDGASWSQTLAGRTVFSLAVYPVDYCFAGTDASIYRSNDDGVNWNQLANSPQGVRSLAVSSNEAGGMSIFAGTYGGGVFLSNDDGTSWTPVNTGLGNLNVWTLAVSGTDLFAGTRGGGVWRRPLSEMITETNSICGTLFNDVNNNGAMEETEQGLPGWTIHLIGTVSPSVTTNSQGQYCFTSLPAGTYTASEEPQIGWNQTCPQPTGTYVVALSSGQNINNLNFGNNSCIPQWSPLGNGVNAYVCALAVIGPDLYVGGSFATAGNINANCIAKWNSLSSSWSQLGTGVNGTVHALAVNGTDLFAGGEFTTAGGAIVNGIAKWNSLTSSWSALGSGVGGTYPSSFPVVYALAVHDHFVYAGGQFTSAGGADASRIAKWDILNSSWSTLGNGVNGPNPNVMAITFINNDLYAAGLFTTAGSNVNVNNIAKWNDPNWSPLGSGTNDWVQALTIFENNLYAAGLFTNAGDVSANYIAKWDVSTLSWSALGNGTSNGTGGPNPWILSLAVLGTDLYAGGAFTTAGDMSANYIALWNSSSGWSHLASEVNSDVQALAFIGTDLYAGGVFNSAGGISAKYIARWGCMTTPVSVGEDRSSNTLPHRFLLEQSYPNPFNPSTTIEYQVPVTAFVKLSVFDILGREIAILVNENKSAGKYRVTFDPSGYPAGAYFYRMQAGKFQETRKLVLIK